MKKNKLIFLGIICLIVAGVIYCLKNNAMNKINEERVSMSNLLEYNDNYLNRFAYVDIYVTPYMIAEYKNDKNAFYIVYDNNYYSVLYMNKKEASKITKEMVDNGYRIYGITKEKPEGIEEHGIEFLKKLFATHEEGDGHNHNVSIEDYEKYFGTIYLDATNKYEGLTVYNVLMFLFGIIGMLLLLVPIYNIIIKKID